MVYNFDDIIFGCRCGGSVNISIKGKYKQINKKEIE